MPGSRRKGRILALQALYEMDTVGHDPHKTLERLVREKAVSENPVAFARELVDGVLENSKQLDELIQKTAPAWPLGQLAAIDRNILRLAIYEILINNKVPVSAAINEAVELAKAFGSENSAKFINGVLGSLSPTAAR